MSLAGQQADALINELTDELTAAAEPRKRSRRKLDELRFRRVLRMVIANAFWAKFFRFSPRVCYSRRKDNNRHGRPEWLSPKCLVKVIDGLDRAGLLSTEKGAWGLFPGTGDSSTFIATPSLVGRFAKHRIVFADLICDPTCVTLVRMRDKDGQTVDIEPADVFVTTAQANLEAINASISGANLELECSLHDLEALTQKMRSAPVQEQGYAPRRPEFFRAVLYRQFNNASWAEGGRFYGGWWQSIPSGWRSKITIDGQPTSELDFSGFSVRALYHLRDIDYQGDPYHLEQFGNGQSSQTYRADVKVITQALINGRPGGRPELAKLPSRRKLPKGLKRKHLREWIETKHVAIGEAFCSGIGLRLQALDARIAEAILLRGVEEDVVILPIHDSFIVQSKYANWLRDVMRDCYRDHLGFEPAISQSH